MVLVLVLPDLWQTLKKADFGGLFIHIHNKCLKSTTHQPLLELRVDSDRPCPSQDWSGVKTVLCIGVRRTKTESIQREQLKEVEDLEANLDVNVEGKKKDLRALRRKPLSNI